MAAAEPTEPGQHAPQAGMVTHRASAGTGRLRVQAVALAVGRDVTVTIGGGSHWHVGATAVAVPRPSLADPQTRSASASVICITGHKEDELARDTALQLAAATDRVVVVSAGIHVDQASSDDIRELMRNASAVVGEIRTLLTAEQAAHPSGTADRR